MKNELKQPEDIKKKKGKPKSKARKIYDIISTIVEAIIFAVVVLAVVVVVVQKRQGKDISIAGYSFYYVATDSMDPTISPGEVILSRNMTDDTVLHEGDVITFIAPSGTLKGQNETHRIVHLDYNEAGKVTGIKTKGDNPTAGEDPWTVKRSEVKGVYVRTLKLFTFMLSGFAGYFVCIILPLIIVFGLFITGIVIDKVRESKEGEFELSEEDKQKLAQEYLDKLNNGEQLPGDQQEDKQEEQDMFELDDFARAAMNTETDTEAEKTSKEEMEKQARIEARLKEILQSGPQQQEEAAKVEVVEKKVVEPFRLVPVEVSYDTSKLPESAPTLEDMIDYSDFEESDIGGFQD